MNATTLPELMDTLTVCHSTTSAELLRVIAYRCKRLARRARRQGRTAGEVEVEHAAENTYLLTWKDTHPVSDQPKREFPTNSGPLSAGGGSYLSSETLNGVRVKLLRDVESNVLADKEVKEVIEYRLNEINDELEQLSEQKSVDPEAEKLYAHGLTTLRNEYRWMLQLIEGPQHT
jgi:hypothetical protein